MTTLGLIVSQQARAAEISPDGSVAAVGYSDGTVVTFTLPDQTPGWLNASGGGVRALRFTPDGKLLLVATREGAIERLPACPLCDDTGALARLAMARVDHGRRLGLTAVGG